MSIEEINDIQLQLATITAVLKEREASSERRGKVLNALVAAVACQLLFTIFYAGVKTAQLERLSIDVISIQEKLNIK